MQNRPAVNRAGRYRTDIASLALSTTSTASITHRRCNWSWSV